MAKRTRASKDQPADLLPRVYGFLARLAYELQPWWTQEEVDVLARGVRAAIEEEEERGSELFRAHLERERQEEAAARAELARLREAAGPVPCTCGDTGEALAVEASR